MPSPTETPLPQFSPGTRTFAVVARASESGDDNMTSEASRGNGEDNRPGFRCEWGLLGADEAGTLARAKMPRRQSDGIGDRGQRRHSLLERPVPCFDVSE